MPPARKERSTRPAACPPSPHKRQRAPQRCRKCDGRPLRSQCIHGGGKKTVPVNAVEVARGTPETEAVPGNLSGAAPGLTSELAPENTPNDINSPSGDPVGAIDAVPAAVADAVDAVPTDISDAVDAVPAAVSDDAVPTAVAEAVPSLGLGGTTRSSTPLSPSGRRVYPSSANLIFGAVSGVGRGNEKATFPRTRPARVVCTTTKDAQKISAYGLKDLLTRIESFSDATNAYAYFAIQHPWSRTPFIHYTSRKLRREAPEEVRQIHRDVSRIMSQVKRADRARFLELVQSNDAAEDRAQAAEAEAERLRTELSNREQTLEARERLLQTLLGAITTPNGAAISALSPSLVAA